jgi:hypothetical protein
MALAVSVPEREGGFPWGAHRQCFRRASGKMFHRSCLPSLSGAEIEAVLSQGLRAKRHISDATLKAKTGITPTEIESLDLAVGRVRREPRTRTKKAEIAARRGAILDLERDGHSTIRRMAQLLKSRGFFVSREIVRQDYRALKSGDHHSTPMGASQAKSVNFCAYVTASSPIQAEKLTEIRKSKKGKKTK